MEIRNESILQVKLLVLHVKMNLLLRNRLHNET